MFTSADDRWGEGSAGAVAVVSYSFWKRSFAGNSRIIGQTVRLNRHSFTIVGVTPPWFTGLDMDRGYDVAIPIGCQPVLYPQRKAQDEVHHWWLRILGRVPPGESVQQADARMQSIAPEIFRASVPPDQSAQDQAQYLKTKFQLRSAALGFSDTRVEYRTALYVLMATAGLVLLIACANIASLLLARGAARRRELSVRMAIGASRPRIIRQLMTESILLAVFGGIAGLLLGVWGSRVLVAQLSTTVNPLEIDVSPDLPVLAFTLGITILTVVLFGLMPALRLTRVGASAALKERVALAGLRRFDLRKALVAGQIVLSLVLLVGAGLFLGTLRNLLTVDPGFNPHNVLLITASVPPSVVPPQQRARTYDEVLGRLRALPGVVVGGEFGAYADQS